MANGECEIFGSVLLRGLQPAVRFLAFVDLLGTTYTAPSLATGYGAHIALPILREAVDPNPDAITEDAAREILRNCMRVLFYRDARSLDKVRNYALRLLRTLTCRTSTKSRRLRRQAFRYQTPRSSTRTGTLRIRFAGTVLRHNDCIRSAWRLELVGPAAALYHICNRRRFAHFRCSSYQFLSSCRRGLCIHTRLIIANATDKVHLLIQWQGSIL